ncbi:hypothetical protein Glove_82g37 [Diversispora epigaea]|uniref:Uncharacterized protein n=1 Tax=Diversispora epigaea TaxID=1348612 RepID=A0A397J8M2_9GLOM|nr:hypothetical protein Glove_82g37 [Diversispora epigaea]
MSISQLSYSKHCILSFITSVNFFKRKPSKSFTPLTFEYLQHKRNIYEGYWYRKPSFLLIKRNTLEHQGEKSYAEQNSGNWWKYAEASISSLACILSLILYLDATTTDTLGKSSLHPIYISLKNISTWRRNKEDTKQLLGYFSILFAKNEKEKTSPEFKKLVRETFHKSLKFLLDPLFENENGIDYKINNRIIWFFPKMSIIIGDWLEACTYSLTYKSASSNFSCHFCLVQKNNLIDTIQVVVRSGLIYTLGKSSLHPIYISLKNISTWRRNKEDTKQLLGYFSILFAKNEKEKTSPEFKKLVRETFHKSLKFLLDPLFENENGIDYKINNRIIWFFPKMSIIIGDWLEACTYSLTYKSASSNFSCHFCLVQKNNLIDTIQVVVRSGLICVICHLYHHQKFNP